MYLRGVYTPARLDSRRVDVVVLGRISCTPLHDSSDLSRLISADITTFNLFMLATNYHYGAVERAIQPVVGTACTLCNANEKRERIERGAHANPKLTSLFVSAVVVIVDEGARARRRRFSFATTA